MRYQDIVFQVFHAVTVSHVFSADSRVREIIRIFHGCCKDISPHCEHAASYLIGERDSRRSPTQANKHYGKAPHHDSDGLLIDFRGRAPFTLDIPTARW